MTAVDRVEGGLDRNFMIMTAATFGFWFAVAVHIPAMPFYLASLGVAEAGIGAVYGSAALFAIVGRLLVVSRVDTHGERMPLVVGAALWLGTAMVPPLTADLAVVTISWALKGAGLGMFTTAASAWVSRYMSDETRGRGLSWWSATNPVATAMAPPLAIWVIAAHGFTVAFGLSAVAALLAMGAGLVPSTAEPGEGTVKTRLLGSALLPGGIGLVLAVAATGFTVFVPLGLGGDQASLAGWPLTLYAVGSFVIRVVSGPAIDKVGAVPTIRGGLLIAAIGIALVGVPSPYPVLLTASLILGAGVGTLAPALAAWTAQRSPRETRGAATGTYFLIYEIGLIIGGATFGAALGLIGDAAYITTGAILLILGLLATAGSTRQDPQTPPTPAER